MERNRGWWWAVIGGALLGLSMGTASAASASEHYATPASEAEADVTLDDPEEPVKLVPVEEPGPNLVPFNNRYRIAVPGGNWATIRHQANGGYVLGLAADGWTFDTSVRANDANWYGGYVYGDAQGCAWILSANLDPKSGTPANVCPTTSPYYYPPNFARSLNCASCSGGRAVLTVIPAVEWSNVRPWINPTPGPTGGLRTAYAGTCVEWRYVTRDGQWVMAKDRSVANPDGSWVFIGRGAFPADLETNPAYQGQASC